uniref:Uncharacterized protein n=1 Tax=Angiostrongylus cantonensis TaxID=6313 RepID=A0A0K0DK86_ANGCA
MPPPGTSRVLTQQLTALRLDELTTTFPFRHLPTHFGPKNTPLVSSGESEDIEEVADMNQVPFASTMARRTAIVEGMELDNTIAEGGIKDIKSEDGRFPSGMKCVLIKPSL